MTFVFKILRIRTFLPFFSKIASWVWKRRKRFYHLASRVKRHSKSGLVNLCTKKCINNYILMFALCFSVLILKRFTLATFTSQPYKIKFCTIGRKHIFVKFGYKSFRLTRRRRFFFRHN